MSSPLVYVIVLAWNHKDETIACLTSMLASDYPNARYVVADNGSTDGTAEAVRELFPGVQVVRTQTNLGIAGGYNMGMQYALAQRADYLLIANNDIDVDPTMLRHLVETLNSQSMAGMVMPKIHHYYGDQSRLWCPGAYWRRFPPGVKTREIVRDGPRYNVLRKIEYAPSCCLLIRREAVEQVGYFDTHYYFYNDDWDYSIRMREAGYSILFVPEAKIWHKISTTTKKGPKPERWWRALGQSTVLFYLRHAARWELIAFVIWFAIRESLKFQFGRIPPFMQGASMELRSHRQRRT
jgi:hypothetical protein